MKVGGTLRHFVPGWFATLHYLVRFRALVSPRAYVDLSSLLTLGHRTSIGSYARVKARRGRVRIGARTDVGTGCFIGDSEGGLEIGDDCLISPNVSITGDGDLATPTPQPTWIGNNVWIGTGAVVLAGAVIEDGVIVSPNSVVSGQIGANAIVQGSPGKIIFTRR